jgi:hypothetical protein
MGIQVTGGGGGGTDADAIHDNVAGEINAIAAKAAPVAADLVLTEDSADSNNKKKVQLGALGLTDIGARVFNNADVTINHATMTAHAFNSERWDTDGMHDNAVNNTRLTCKTAGKYVVSAMCTWNDNNTGYRGLAIDLNGAREAWTVLLADAAYTEGHVVSTIIDMDVNDYVEMIVYQTSTAGLDTNRLADYSPEFAAQMIAKAA